MADRRRTPEEMLREPAPKPPSMMEATPFRQEVRNTVDEGIRLRQQVMSADTQAYRRMAQPLLARGDPETVRKVKDSQLHRFFG